ncbi:MAG: hypothetical protein ACRENP_04310 [Longimicrobiales bacterium]
MIPPVTGTVRVTIATTGLDLDSDGYDLIVDGFTRNRLRVSVNGSIVIGIHSGNLVKRGQTRLHEYGQRTPEDLRSKC